MRRLLAVAVCVEALGSAACRPREDKPTRPDATSLEGVPLRIATFNVRRFFDTVCDSGACEYGDYEALATRASFEQRAAELARAIRTLDADIISLQEIETQPCLDALLANLQDAMPHGVLGEIGWTASVDVAVLSKTPIATVVRHRDANPLVLPDGSTTTFSRELLEVHVATVEGAEVVVFAAHFRSKFNDDPDRRLAEARTSSQIVNELAARAPEAVIVLAGDLNDTPGSPPLDALVVDGGLVRVADDVPPAEQETYTYQGNGQAIDHILLAPNSNATRIPRSTRSWRDGTDAGWGGSDHAALTSDFVLPSD